MTKNTKTVVLVAIAAAVLIVSLFVIRDQLLGTKTITCSDGPRRTIDVRDFNTKYWTYSVQFEASVADKAKFSGKLDPVQLQQLSEAMQSANEFRRYVVAGYDSCAITGEQYAQYGSRFQALDGLARQIDNLVRTSGFSPEDRVRLQTLTKEYVEITEKAVAK